jgi:chitinase
MESKGTITKSQNIQSAARNIVGYYAAWTANSGFTPAQIDATKLTHINYAFANIGPDLKITLGFPYIDPYNFCLLDSLKQTNPNLKTLISVGGWTWSGSFSDVALTEDSRKAFADSCVAFIKQYGFDGVDIDWEYPVTGGLPTNIRRPEDKYNFTLLLQTLREKLDAQGSADGKHYLLTIAGGSGSNYPSNVELSLIYPFLDYASIMTYDIHGTWDTYTDFNAPLYMNNDISPQFKWSVDSAIRLWDQEAFPMNKLMMGIPFYGYLYSSVNNYNDGLYQPFFGANSIPFEQVAANYLDYPGFTRFFHHESKAPWLFNSSIFISYDDPESIRYKTDYIKANGLGGAMIWELSEDPYRVLLYCLYDDLK